ncbi:MAG: hypothetical protein ACLP9L_04305 [Thermoguttaceae bacterium]
MHSLRKNSWTFASWLILLALAFSGCCQSGHKPCEDIPPGAIPQPNGTYDCQWIHAETARADRDNFVIYQYEWSADGTKLTQFGQEHVARIAQGLSQVCFPVVIEPVSDQRLNEIRRLAVLEALANCHVPIVPERVVLARSEAEGLYGDEAAGVAGRMLRNNVGGQGAGSTGGAAGSMGGGATGSISGGASTSGGGTGIY